MAQKVADSLIHIIGFGATGRLWAANLSASGRRVVAHGRQHTYTSVIRENDQQNWSLSEDDGTPFEIVLFCTKGYQFGHALSTWRARITPKTHVVIACNGMGYEHMEIVRQYLSPSQIYFLVHSHAAMRGSTANSFIQTGEGEGWLGALLPTDEPTKKFMINALHCKLLTGWSEHIQSMRWRKLAVNALINPISALLNCPNGALRAPEVYKLWQTLANEIEAIAKSVGHGMSAAEILTWTQQVASQTAANYSSMHQDLHHGRPTEIDVINGFICQQALKYKKNAPANTFLTQMIKSAEQLGHYPHSQAKGVTI